MGHTGEPALIPLNRSFSCVRNVMPSQVEKIGFVLAPYRPVVGSVVLPTIPQRCHCLKSSALSFVPRLLFEAIFSLWPHVTSHMFHQEPPDFNLRTNSKRSECPFGAAHVFPPCLPPFYHFEGSFPSNILRLSPLSQMM